MVWGCEKGKNSFQAAFSGVGNLLLTLFLWTNRQPETEWSGDGSSPTASNRAWLVYQNVGEPPTLHWGGFSFAEARVARFQAA
nr:hypothetical protein [uncultured Kingella sp.]